LMDSIWINTVWIPWDFVWNLCGLRTDCLWVMHGWIYRGFHMDSVWILHGFSVDSVRILHALRMDSVEILRGLLRDYAWILYDYVWIVCVYFY
jgi:hypothetical protein